MKSYTERKEKKTHKNRFLLRLAALVVFLMILVSGSAWYLSINASNPERAVNNKNIIALEAPPLFPLGDNGSRSSFLDSEAGMSAYTNVGETIDLNEARTAFRTIEYETSTYIIGSVPLPDYPETEDIHCYVHVSGWIVTYYHKDEPTSKILDWSDYNPGGGITGTKLDDGINVVCDAAYVVSGAVQYFNFEWPNGQKMMILAEEVESTYSYDSFIITLPSTFTFYERSYSLHTVGGGALYLNEVGITSGGCGLLTGSQLPTGVANTVKVYRSGGSEAVGALVLIYREP